MECFKDDSQPRATLTRTFCLPASVHEEINLLRNDPGIKDNKYTKNNETGAVAVATKPTEPEGCQLQTLTETRKQVVTRLTEKLPR